MNRSSRVHGLDTLRALAIMLVFANHYMSFVSHEATFGWFSQIGWAGVDLFFALSGYLIGNQIFAGMRDGGAAASGFSLWRFYARRLLRTVPAFYFVLALYAFWPYWAGSLPHAPWWKYLTFTLNFDLKPGTLFSHAWSLCVEEQFYLLLPPVALAIGAIATAGRHRTTQAASASSATGRSAAPTAVSASSAASSAAKAADGDPAASRTTVSAGGMDAAADGVDAVADGVSAAADGAGATEDGEGATAGGVDAVADGVGAAADGAGAAADGAGAVADGEGATADGEGATADGVVAAADGVADAGWTGALRQRRRMLALALGWSALAAAVAVGMWLRADWWQPSMDMGARGSQRYYTLIYYSTLARFDELLAGVALAMLRNFHPALWQRLTSHGNAMLAAGSALTALAFWLLLEAHFSWSMSVFGYPLLGLAFAMLLLAALSQGSLLARTRIPGMGAIALWSYSIYLTHKQLCILLAEHFAPDQPVSIALMIAASIFAGWLLYFAVETPFMYLRERFIPSNYKRRPHEAPVGSLAATP